MTGHWIDETTLARKKAALACSRFKGRHTYDAIASAIEEVHNSHGLCGSKVVATVTDNGSNFVKAFNWFGSSTSTTVPGESPTVSSPVVSVDADLHEEGSEEATFVDLTNILGQAADGEPVHVLPAHKRCASHTLNLVNKDIDKCLATSQERVTYRSSMAKCSALWAKSTRSSRAAEVVEQEAKQKLLIPCETRWNSLYDALNRIVNIGLVKLNAINKALDLKCFSEKELSLLQQYCAVAKPLTEALDVLQGEDNCYYGFLLPVLASLKSKLLGMSNESCLLVPGMREAILNALERRFAGVQIQKDAKLAAVAHPFFKTKWVDSVKEKQELKALLLVEMINGTSHTHKSPDSSTQGRDDRQAPAGTSTSFFNFVEEDEAAEDKSPEVKMENELNDFLKNAKTVASLSAYPAVREVFLKYNCILPSSASVERLFSLGGLILTPRRNRLGDGNFERLVLLRYNKG